MSVLKNDFMILWKQDELPTLRYMKCGTGDFWGRRLWDAAPIRIHVKEPFVEDKKTEERLNEDMIQ